MIYSIDIYIIGAWNEFRYLIDVILDKSIFIHFADITQEVSLLHLIIGGFLCEEVFHSIFLWLDLSGVMSDD